MSKFSSTLQISRQKATPDALLRVKAAKVLHLQILPATHARYKLHTMETNHRTFKTSPYVAYNHLTSNTGKPVMRVIVHYRTVVVYFFNPHNVSGCY